MGGRPGKVVELGTEVLDRGNGIGGRLMEALPERGIGTGTV